MSHLPACHRFLALLLILLALTLVAPPARAAPVRITRSVPVAQAAPPCAPSPFGAKVNRRAGPPDRRVP